MHKLQLTLKNNFYYLIFVISGDTKMVVKDEKFRFAIDRGGTFTGGL